MKKPTTLLTTIALICGAAPSVLAQDTLFFRSGHIVAATVEEIGLDDITYHEPSDAVRLVVEKKDVARIKMHDGRVLAFQDRSLGVEYSEEVLKKKHVVKMELLSLAFDHLTIGYEQVLKPGMNAELRASYIGVGNSKIDHEATGMMVAGGIKFISRPDHVVRGMKLNHPLHGRYVKPEILFNTFTVSSKNEVNYGGSTGSVAARRAHITYTNVAFNVIFGKQRLLGDGVTLDTWVGVGYAVQGAAGNSAYDDPRRYFYSHVLLGRQTPIALSCGLSIGVAF